MKSLNSKLSVITVCLVLVIFNASNAGQSVDFSDEALAKDILLDKSLTCLTEGSTGKGTLVFSFKAVEGNKVKGEITEMSWNSCDWDVFKGSLKKDVLFYQAHASTNCPTLIGKINFFHSKKGVVKATGSWRTTSNRYSQGTYECEQ